MKWNAAPRRRYPADLVALQCAYRSVRASMGAVDVAARKEASAVAELA